MNADTVIARIEPCTCGCKGSDPWHRSNFRRVLRNVEELPAGSSARIRAYGDARPVSKRARVSLPWGTATAVLVVVAGRNFAWFVEA